MTAGYTQCYYPLMAMTNREKQAAYRARRREAGLCLESGCQTRKPKRYARCKPCRALAAERREYPEWVRERDARHDEELRAMKHKYETTIGELIRQIQDLEAQIHSQPRPALPVPGDPAEYDAVLQLPAHHRAIHLVSTQT